MERLTYRLPEYYSDEPPVDYAVKYADTDVRLQELSEADKAGRVVVLPCKIGDTVWCCNLGGMNGVHEYKVVAAHVSNTTQDVIVVEPQDYKGQGYGIYLNRFYDSVFLTREEAEKALEAMKDG